LKKFAPATKMSPKEPQPENIWHGNKNTKITLALASQTPC
jgi:hypothetical protein